MIEDLDVITKNGYTGYVRFDPDPENPRDWDNLGTIHAAHRNYDLGDVQVKDGYESLHLLSQEEGVVTTCQHCGLELEYEGGGAWIEKSSDYMNRDDLDVCSKAPVVESYGFTYQQHKPQFSGVTIYPVFSYEHGGITVSMGAFSCPYDSGQLGIIYVTDEKLKKEFWGVIPDPEKIKELLDGEIKTYASYLEGMIYCYEIEDGDGNYVDSLYGFYDEDECKNEMILEMERL
jgi:hypothetical protein